LNSLPEGLNYC